MGSGAAEHVKIGPCASARWWCLEPLWAGTLYSRIDAATADYCHGFAGAVPTREALQRWDTAREGLGIVAVAVPVVRYIIVLACVLAPRCQWTLKTQLCLGFLAEGARPEHGVGLLLTMNLLL